jgi:hypothetical protein
MNESAEDFDVVQSARIVLTGRVAGPAPPGTYFETLATHCNPSPQLSEPGNS